MPSSSKVVGLIFLAACAGPAGMDAVNTLVSVVDEAPGTNCQDGGSAILTGVDDDDDGMLDPAEVNATTYVCAVRGTTIGDTLQGGYVVRNNLDAALIAEVLAVTGDLVIAGPLEASIELPYLEEVGGSLRIEREYQGPTLAVPSLSSIGADLTMASGTELQATALQSIGGDLWLDRPDSQRPLMLQSLSSPLALARFTGSLIEAVDIGASVDRVEIGWWNPNEEFPMATVPGGGLIRVAQYGSLTISWVRFISGAPLHFAAAATAPGARVSILDNRGLNGEADIQVAAASRVEIQSNEGPFGVRMDVLDGALDQLSIFGNVGSARGGALGWVSFASLDSIGALDVQASDALGACHIDPLVAIAGTSTVSGTSPCQTLGWCRLQGPISSSVPVGAYVEMIERLSAPGLTDLSSSIDPAETVWSQVGFGPTGSDPGLDAADWYWEPSSTPWSGAADEVGVDEYRAVLLADPAGSYDVSFRQTVDGGKTFSYCDGAAAGSADGYQGGNAGTLVSAGDSTCDDAVCSWYESCDPDCGNCGDSACDLPERYANNCLDDCPVCGDGTCGRGEDVSCADDCAVCGDGTCQPIEALFCIDDCGCHDACVAGGPLDPTCGACVDAICTDDPVCCADSWDEYCIASVATLCAPATCP